MSGYRYGFQGFEADDEVKGQGNSYTTEFRQYDPRVGRWLSIDSREEKYPETSPYVSFGNNPILFIDTDGDTLRVVGSKGQNYVKKTLIKTFGDKASDFDFNKDGDLVFSGDPALYKGDEKTVLDGLVEVIKGNMTVVEYRKNDLTDNHGGEYTATLTDNPDLKNNKITIDPVEKFERSINVYETTYVKEDGSLTTNDRDPRVKINIYTNEPIKGEVRKSVYTTSDSRAARFFHGLGHVLYPESDEQESVIDYDNAARSSFKKKRIFGDGFKKKPESQRGIDDEHKNKP